MLIFWVLYKCTIKMKIYTKIILTVESRKGNYPKNALTLEDCFAVIIPLLTIYGTNERRRPSEFYENKK